MHHAVRKRAHGREEVSILIVQKTMGEESIDERLGEVELCMPEAKAPRENSFLHIQDVLSVTIEPVDCGLRQREIIEYLRSLALQNPFGLSLR